MAAIRVVGSGPKLPAHANVREEPEKYLIELDVADFTESAARSSWCPSGLEARSRPSR